MLQSIPIHKAYNESEFIEYTLRTLIKDQEAFKITSKKDGSGIQYDVTLANSDMKHVIGSHGNTINALRTVLKAVCYTMQCRAKLKISSKK